MCKLLLLLDAPILVHAEVASRRHFSQRVRMPFCSSLSRILPRRFSLSTYIGIAEMSSSQLKMNNSLSSTASNALDNEPKHAKSDSISYLPHWEGHLWILVHACWPMLIHQLLVWYTGQPLSYVTVSFLYIVAFNVNAVHELRELGRLGQIHGHFDGDKHARDPMPENSEGKIFRALLSTSTFRPFMTIFLAYNREAPTSMSLWLPVEIGLYTVILDFWFYWYHRSMHDIDILWKYHRTHHLTKHPNALLTLYADIEQEIFDIAVIPLMTWGTLRLLGFPMGFFEWWVCHQYIVWTELWGHSGLRLYVTPPTTATPLLKLFDAELTTEDHDLHHRKGWKSSHNYGKQTRLWDQIFRTTHERYESTPANIDWNSPERLRTFIVF
nr:fatty acid hydroxylase vlma [Quercus suber]